MKSPIWRNYIFTTSLLGAIFLGSCLGMFLKEKSIILKPLGDIFLNLLFMIVVPMVFFSIASAVATMADGKRLGKILGAMLCVFVITGVISSLLMLGVVLIYPPAQGLEISISVGQHTPHTHISEQIVKAFTAADFSELLSKKNLLALIVFSVLIGLAASTLQEKSRPFVLFLQSGNEVMMKAVSIIMLYAPFGLGAYFAYLVGVFGPELLGSYVRAMVIYYPVAIGYFLVAFSLYAYLAGRGKGVKTFWGNILPTSLTALATGSSVASIPANLDAARKSGIPEDIREVVIPIGATIHMDGSCLSAVLKIALLFGIFGMDFSHPGTICSALGVALLSGTVMSGIPGGGFTGELMIVSLYGFPPEALPIISMVGTLVDPPATMVNAVGDNVASMMVARILGGPRWMEANRA